MPEGNGYPTSKNARTSSNVGGGVGERCVVHRGLDATRPSDTGSDRNIHGIPKADINKEFNKPTGSIATRSRSLQSLPRSEGSSGKGRVRTANSSLVGHDKTKNTRRAESQNSAGVSVRIGGKTFVFKEEPVNHRASLKSSTKSQKPTPQKQIPPAFPTEAYGQPPTISSSHGINYLSNKKPFLGLETIRALNSAYPFGRVQTSSYPYTLPASSHSGQLRSEMKSSTLAGDLCQVFSVFFAILVRVILGVFSILTVWVVVDKRNDTRFWGLTAILILFVVEGVHTVVKRRGQERKWVSLCFVCYLLASIPSVWLLELQKLGVFESKYPIANNTEVEVPGLSSKIVLTSDDLIFVLENCLVFLLILCRWLLPRGDISRDQLSQLLFVFIGMGSDVMELFQLFDEEEVKQRRNLTYIILAVWSFSLFQFTLVLTMSANPKKARVALNPNTHTSDTLTTAKRKLANRNIPSYTGFGDRAPVRQKRTFKEFLVYSEVWSLIVTILMQDGPYLAVRLYVVVELSIINSNIIFFVCKNAIVICLLLYRLIVVALRVSEDDDDDSDDGMDFLFKDFNVNGNGAGSGRWAKSGAVPTASGQSAVTDVTTLTPAPASTRPAKQELANPSDNSHSYGDEMRSRSEPAPPSTNERLEATDSATSVVDDDLEDADSAHSAVDDDLVIGSSAHPAVDDDLVIGSSASFPAADRDFVSNTNAEEFQR